MIDAEELARTFDLHHHKRAANAYFEQIGVDHPVMRKPFADVAEAIHLLPGVAATIDALQLFKGARILDFGCGGGWLTRLLASLDCQAVGVDFAASAAKVAEQAAALDRFAATASFAEYDGKTLAFDDASFDGAIVFDCFHHVPNQEEVLAELFRVLRPGASICFHEPGPEHSRSAQSQMEMRNFGVIERDVDMAKIAHMAEIAGFTAPQMAVVMQNPLWVPLPGFDNFLSADQDIGLSQSVRNSYANLRIFKLTKPGLSERDSRTRIGLSGIIDVVHRTVVGTEVQLELVLRNDGEVSWRPSGHEIGSVNLGIQRSDQRDFARVAFSANVTRPGETVRCTITVPNETDISIDLVAEGVIWFEQMTGRRVTI